MRDEAGIGNGRDRGEVEIALARFALMLARPVDAGGAPMDAASIVQAAHALAARVEPAEGAAMLERLCTIARSLAGVKIDVDGGASHAA
jgi:hypothetical protein